jgi:hypothetical protein
MEGTVAISRSGWSALPRDGQMNLLPSLQSSRSPSEFASRSEAFQPRMDVMCLLLSMSAQNRILAHLAESRE